LIRQTVKEFTDVLFAFENINLLTLRQSWSLHNKKRQDMQPGPATRPKGASGHFVGSDGENLGTKPPRYFGKPPVQQQAVRARP
jgi:hypothetical protein